MFDRRALTRFRRRLPFFACLLAGAALFCRALPVSGAVLMDTVDFASSPFPQSLVLPQFNEALGQLTGVSVTLTTTTTLESDVMNTGPAASYTGASASGTTSFNGLPDINASDTISTAPAGGSIGAGTFQNPAVVRGQEISATSSQVLQIAPADFGAYEGPAGNQLLFDVNFLASYSGNGPGSLIFGGEADASGFVEVSYSYTAFAAAPEPGTWCAGAGALMAAGLAWRRLLRPRRWATTHLP